MLYEDMFSQRLVELRMKKGVSARDMSLSIGQSAGYINSIENKHSLPSMTVFYYICEYLNIMPAEFFEEGNDNPIEMRELIHAWKLINKEQRTHLLAIIKDLKKR